jgi:peptidoglycan/LPS O-acetylase OafA/YrhL
MSTVSKDHVTRVVGQRDGKPKSWYLGLDGVRAIAVLLVFSSHYIGAKVTVGGWIGVPIFFVLSGFLITGILYDNQNEPYRFRNFYIRRTLRIFPLFYFSWLLVLIAGYFLHAQWHAADLFWLLYLGNYVRFFAGTPGLDHIFTLNQHLPIEIGHFWSLAVEEQFYLIWPLVVFLVGKRKTLIRICVSAIIFVPILRTVLFFVLPQDLLSMGILFRLTFVQCDAFLLGGLIALWMRGPEKSRLLLHSNKILYGSLGALVAAYLLNSGTHMIPLTGDTPWMSTYGFTLVDLTAAGLILCSLRPGSIVFRVMTLWPLRIVGKYSYGIYVYHVLLAPFLRYYVWPVNDIQGTWLYRIHVGLSTILYLLIVLAVSVCSYHFVELPFLGMKERFTMRHRNPDADDRAAHDSRMSRLEPQ